MLLRALKIAFLVVVFAGVLALIGDTYYQGQDFEVFLRAARTWLSHQKIYEAGLENGMVFKYPPWILPVFIPFALLSVPIAKLLWGIGEIFCLGFVVQKLFLAGVRPIFLAIAVCGFWGIWAVHAMDGQMTLLMLACAFSESYVLKAWGLSTKVFTLFGLVGCRQPKLREILVTGGVFLLLGILASGFSIRAARENLISWKTAASSGGALLSPDKTRGRDNQGFPVLLERIFINKDTSGDTDVFFSVILMSLFVPLYFLGTRGMDPISKLVIALGLSAALHPLAWFHLFVLAFPLAAIALDRTWKKPSWFFLASLGFCLLAMTTRNTLGRWGEQLELLSIKSWGVLILCVCVIGVFRASKTGQNSTASVGVI